MLQFRIKNNMYRCILFLFLPVLIPAQLLINGTITGAQSGLPVPFASIGISGKHYGTLSKENGSFKLNLPYITDTDTLKISAIGYESLSLPKKEIIAIHNKVISLVQVSTGLAEVKITAKKLKQKVLGTQKYSKENCTAFITDDQNWLGSQAAIKAGNKKGRVVYIESFNFYIIKNTYQDSLRFRLMFYAVSPKGYPSKTFLKKPVIFKTNIQQGEVNVNLRDYNIITDDDFFISLECLEENLDESRFCFAGSVKVPSYAKTAALNYWKYVKGGGADLNVKVSYVTD